MNLKRVEATAGGSCNRKRKV